MLYLLTRGEGATRKSIAATMEIQSQPMKSKTNDNFKMPLLKKEDSQSSNVNTEVDVIDLSDESPSPQKVDVIDLLDESPSPKKVDIIDISDASSSPRKFEVIDLLESSASSWQHSTCTMESEVNDRVRPHKNFNLQGSGIYEDIEAAIDKLSLVDKSRVLEACHWNPFSALLTVCGQTIPSALKSMIRDEETLVKVGEGTFGEAFKVGDFVFKVVPFGGDCLVNGEQQKKTEELLEEVVLSCTLNQLKENGAQVSNACNTFIQTLDLRVCQGHYDSALISAWEKWDKEHHSENEHPKIFPENQCYLVFVLDDGGQDLEKFVLLNFDEARSMLVQVTLALAVAEAAYEFEHRDLHWGNILLSRKESRSLPFILEGKQVLVKNFGLHISIIDFTLSRISAGKDVIFLDLLSDPELFKGPKGDKQADTYRKMREVTQDKWEGCFPKTNVLWLQYLVDILLTKKSYDQTAKQKKEMRSFRKRLNGYMSAKEAFMKDAFFTDLLVHEC